MSTKLNKTTLVKLYDEISDLIAESEAMVKL